MTSVIDYTAKDTNRIEYAENLFRKLRKEWFNHHIMETPKEEPSEEDEIKRLEYNTVALECFNEETELLLQGNKLNIAPNRISFNFSSRD